MTCLPRWIFQATFWAAWQLRIFFRSAIKNSQSLVGNIPIPIQFIFAFTCTGTTIIFWEFYENLLDLFFGTHMVRGLEDTIVDMF